MSCKPKRSDVERETNGKASDEPPPRKKTREELSEEYASGMGKFKWGPLNFIIALIFFVPIIVFAVPKYRVGAPVNNSEVQYAGIPHEIQLSVRLVLTFIITGFIVTWTARLGTKMLSIRALWIIYFAVGAIFHLTGWEQMALPGAKYAPASWRGSGFTGTAAMHVMAELMLSLSTVIPRSQSEWWNTRIVVYGYLATFLAMACQQKTISLYVIVGGGFALPADTFTLIAGYAIWQRAKDSSVKMFAAAWALNTPVILYILAMLNWRSTSEDNWTGFGVWALQIQYILLAASVGKLIVLRELPNDELEKELREKGILAPDPELDGEDDEESGGLMKGTSKPKKSMSARTAFMITGAVMTFLFAVNFFLPIFTGHLQLKRFLE